MKHIIFLIIMILCITLPGVLGALLKVSRDNYITGLVVGGLDTFIIYTASYIYWRGAK